MNIQALLAFLPILLVIVLMAGLNVKSVLALPAGLLAAAIVALFFWEMAPGTILGYAIYGAFRSIDIILIILGAILILNTLKESGAMTTISNGFNASITCRLRP